LLSASSNPSQPLESSSHLFAIPPFKLNPPEG
jgi:hypothetical protein